MFRDLTSLKFRGQPKLNPAERSTIAAALRHYDGNRYRLAGYVVMNDHVHAVVEPAAGHRPEAIVQAWKSSTAHLLYKETARKSPLWLDEYFASWAQSEMELTEKLEYIHDSPWRRWPELEALPCVASVLSRTRKIDVNLPSRTLRKERARRPPPLRLRRPNRTEPQLLRQPEAPHF